MNSSVVYIVAKAPRPGTAKTRLSPPLTPEQAARVAEAFLLDVLGLARQARALVVRAMCRDQSDLDHIRQLCGRHVEVLCQLEPGLSAALEECFIHGLADGFAKVAVLGGDSPTLPPGLIEQAFDALDSHDVVVGPTEDGGYYLLGARAAHPMLLRGMVWSTDRVFEDTMARARGAGLETAVLPPWYDVDTPEDLARIARDLESGPSGLAPHTRDVLKAVDSRGTPS